jgi:hypothetical protein
MCSTVNGESYLVADFTYKCYDSQWNQYLGFALFLVLLYPIGKRRPALSLR